MVPPFDGHSHDQPEPPDGPRSQLLAGQHACPGGRSVDGVSTEVQAIGGRVFLHRDPQPMVRLCEHLHDLAVVLGLRHRRFRFSARTGSGRSLLLTIGLWVLTEDFAHRLASDPQPRQLLLGYLELFTQLDDRPPLTASQHTPFDTFTARTVVTESPRVRRRSSFVGWRATCSASWTAPQSRASDRGITAQGESVVDGAPTASVLPICGCGADRVGIRWHTERYGG